MTNVKHRATPAVSTLNMLVALAVVVSSWLGTVSVVSAAQTSDIQVFTTQNGQSVYDACYELVGYSNVGCDENGDGAVTFQDIPYGTYTLRQTANLGSGRYVADATITVTGAMSFGWESFYTQVVTSGGGSASSSGSADVAIYTTENGRSAYDACYVLVDYSNVGCDENRDGKITFEDIPLGSYTVRQTANLGSGRYVNDFTIRVTGSASSDGWEGFPATIVSTGGGSSVAPNGSVDIALITRDPQDGHLLTGTCYVLVGYSNEGCDENGDGQVTFAAIPDGMYTVRQTQTPAGYPTINDYTINVESDLGVPLGFIVKQAPEQNAPNTRNVSAVMLDSTTGEKITSSVCVQFVGASNVGCDEDLLDGQIDFLDVPSGTYQVQFTNLPVGWQVLGSGMTAPTVTIDASPGSLTHQFAYFQVYTGAGNTDGGGNVAADTGAIAVVGGQTSTAAATDSDTESTDVAVELILDTSDSMNERDQNGQSRIEVAKDVATRLVTETLPPGVPMALRTYAGCSSSLTIPMQPLDPDAAATMIAGLRATGNTPIAQSLRAAAADLDGVSGSKIIVLVTDGEETCDGDPRAVIDDLVAQDVTVQVNIIGFAIDDAALTATFQEWASAGNGAYYQASNELELDQAVTTASRLPFRVLDQQGEVIAGGNVGGVAVPVPAGTYTVEVETDPATRYENVVVTAQQTTTIDVDAGAPTGSASDGSTAIVSTGGSSGSGNTAGATVLMTFRGCPEGFVPGVDDPYAACTEPLDAPDASIIVWGGDGQGGMNIASLDRQFDGAYIYNAGPSTMNVYLSGMAPVVRDAYQVIGADQVSGDSYTTNLVNGETRQVFVYYYYE